MGNDHDQQQFVRTIHDIDPENVKAYGGKAVGLARMARSGVPIPPAIVIGTDGYHAFHENGGVIPGDMIEQIHAGIGYLESQTGREFGGPKSPLLVSVRSGAAISMPGMMDTILNLGLNAESAFEWAGAIGNTGFVLDSWIRFWGMYAETVLDIDADELLDALSREIAAVETAATLESYEALERAALAAIGEQGAEATADPRKQLIKTVAAVFGSWDSPRAQAYRQHHGISDDMGTAVTIQAMVFGNMDDESGTGVAFTRDPNDGSKTLYGEFLTGHQGEDLVSGTHTPIKLSDHRMPDDTAIALVQHGETLERIYRDAVDIEFTVESGTLYFLQVRAAKRTASAAVRIACELVDEGLISMPEAISRVSLDQVANLLRPGFDPEALEKATLLTKGLGSSPGQAAGVAILDSDMAADRADQGENVILLRPTTSPQDIRGMLASNGIVTAKGGALSHAAVVSRALDKPCIVGCEEIEIDLDARTFSVGGKTFNEGVSISIDGADGRVLEGVVPISAGVGSGEALRGFLDMARAVSGAEIWSAPRGEVEAAHAVEASADGVGLVSLTDLVMSRGAMGRFTQSISQLTRDGVEQETLEEISQVVRDACLPLIRAAIATPVHLRLPQLRSERARDLVANWEDIPVWQILPLGSRNLIGAMLDGIARAQSDAGHTDVSVVAGGITDPSEFEAFESDVARTAGLGAGMLVQNAILLQRLAEQPLEDRSIWIDVNEIIRTVHGFPMRVMHMPSVLDDYCKQGLIRANPFRDPGSFLTKLLQSVGRFAGDRFGVTDAGVFGDELLSLLYAAGFRRFSSSTAAGGIVRIKLARLAEE
ncbi:pyruvate, phosphate dikinase [Ectothiorhodospiraceae bacterium WFHF3C12]|nr:pyruvate, phosphate dikinase [Ectothiorhodospiraceae bacterium WFHF3C12]